MVTIRCILAIAVVKNRKGHQLDVNKAFHHGAILEFYMKLPQGYKFVGGANMVSKLKKTLYGLINMHQGSGFTSS